DCRIAVGKIGLAYSQPDGGIWFAAPDGSHPVRLAAGSGDLALSPDGRTVAFTRIQDHPHVEEIYLVPTAGGRPVLVRRFVGRNYVAGLVWSPDSLLLTASTGSGLYLLRAGMPSHGFRFVAGAGGATFSPDGGEIAFQGSTGLGHGLYVYDIARGKTRRFARRGGIPTWGAEALAFSRGLDIWTVAFPGARPKRLTRTGSAMFPVAWSVDGSRLLAATIGFRTGRLWRVDAPSGKARALTGSVLGLIGEGLSYDGRTILAAAGCAGPPVPHPRGTIETIPFAGGEPHVILDGPCRASWNN
ncbi:MAG: PD40 domain-containing protein, partial [Actinobacteria bacterium]|nr:PD40 domain-containing protein [Actinomycetota bacterium]